MLAKIARPSSTAATIVAKLSSASTMSAASLETSVPVMPMATPMSAVFERGRVVDAVAGHRDDGAAALQRLDDAQLVLGIDARVDRHVARPSGRARRPTCVSSSAPVTARAVVGDAELLRRSPRRSRDDRR